MPRIIFYTLLVLVALSLIPLGLVYKSSHSRKAGPRIQPVQVQDPNRQSLLRRWGRHAEASRGHRGEGPVVRG
jgi:hypothetical protein